MADHLAYNFIMDGFAGADEDLLLQGGPHRWCPCSSEEAHRALQDGGEEEEPVVLWQVVYTSLVLGVMFVVLLIDRIGADLVMLATLTVLMAAGIVDVKEGVAGFSNEGVLTVLVLFVVAEGISKTGALDWYIGKFLGTPKNSTSAQIRLMAPMVCVSAFLSNTPIVAVMIPIVQQWSKRLSSSGVKVQQLMIPLSFSVILGGTCTLIGTSTNLVVAGLLAERYPDTSAYNIGLFDLGVYGTFRLLI